MPSNHVILCLATSHTWHMLQMALSCIVDESTKWYNHSRNLFVLSYKVKCALSYDPAISLIKYAAKINESGWPHKHLYRSVHSRFIYTNPWKQVKGSRGREKVYIVIYSHKRAVISNKKDRTTSCDSLSKFPNHNA